MIEEPRFTFEWRKCGPMIKQTHIVVILMNNKMQSAGMISKLRFSKF